MVATATIIPRNRYH